MSHLSPDCGKKWCFVQRVIAIPADLNDSYFFARRGVLTLALKPVTASRFASM
jgi:hypothetical protein